MNKIRNKMKKQGGFTLIEMLVVVAIIAILIAVSIPVVTGALERARIATDAANERAAKAEVLIAYLNGKISDGTDFVTGTPYYYDAVNGKIINNPPAADEVYGKCVSTSHHKGGYITVSVNDEGEVTLEWAGCKEPSGNGPTSHGVDID